MAKFFLRTSQPKGTASLYVRVNRPTLGIQWMVCTKIDVDIECWNKAQKTAKALAQYYATESGKRVQEMTEKVAGIIDDLFINGSLTSNADKEILDNAISGIVNCKGIKALEEAELRKRDEAEKRLCVVWNYYEYFIEGISDGTLRKGRDNEKYRKNSLSVWKTFGKHLRGYLDYKKMQEITFDGINRAFADGFILYLEGKGLMPVTINQQVICFRRLCNAAAIDEKNTNLISVKVWRERNVNDKDKRAEVALSDDEINALYGMRLEGLCEQVRDVWMLGYLSAQRVSDYSRLGRDNFKVTPNGLSVIVLQQKKTGNDVIIPILDERVKELCEKYNYDFPELTRDTINQYIKRVMKELSLTVASLREWSRTQLCLKERNKEQSYISMCKRVECGEELHGEELKRYKRMKEYAEEHESGDKLYKRDYSGAVIKQKWELISCHTSRRSAVTSMYNTGLYDIRDMMSISGHTTLSNFEKYIKRNAVEQAERIAEKARKAKEITLRKEA